MKRLWKVLPPCISDLMGFEAVLNETEGMGLIDDSSRYKPIRFGREGNERREDHRRREGHREYERPERLERSERHERNERLDMESTLEGSQRHGRDEHRGHGGRHDGVVPGVRVINSDIRNEDIITGTENKVLSAFERGAAQFSPNFALLAYGPSASMIGSDLEYAAEKIAGQSGIPTASVKIDGEKDYLYGISCTLETMGRLLLEPQNTIPGSLNILGANTIDWAKETVDDVEKVLLNAGFRILSRWGTKETTENLKMASAASCNLVVNESGLRLARFMEEEFGIPYLAGAPFGTAWMEQLLMKLKGDCTSMDLSAEKMTAEHPASMEPEILIVGEQFMGNAIRQELLHRGYGEIRVLSFYDMDKEYMEAGDKKLTGEDEFAAQAGAETVRVIFADGDLRSLVEKEVRWIPLPNMGSMFPVKPMEAYNMAGQALDAWLDREGL